MRDPERIRRSNRILIGIVILFLLYGILTRLQTGDTSFYLFGFKLFGTEQVTEDAGAASENADAASEDPGAAPEDTGK